MHDLSSEVACIAFIHNWSDLCVDESFCLFQSNIEKIIGHATFTDDKCVEVNGQKYTADHILIATGGRPQIPQNIPGKRSMLRVVAPS